MEIIILDDIQKNYQKCPLGSILVLEVTSFELQIKCTGLLTWVQLISSTNNTYGMNQLFIELYRLNYEILKRTWGEFKVIRLDNSIWHFKNH